MSQFETPVQSYIQARETMANLQDVAFMLLCPSRTAKATAPQN